MKELLIMAKSLGGGGSEVALIELINAALLLAALKILGFKFMVKTIYAIIMLSLFLAPQTSAHARRY